MSYFLQARAYMLRSIGLNAVCGSARPEFQFVDGSGAASAGSGVCTTGPPDQRDLRRTSPIAEAAKATGAEGFEFYVVSDDPRLNDKELRQGTERFLFKWAEQADGFVSWNRQKSWS